MKNGGRGANKNKDLLYRQISREVRKKCAEAKGNWINGKCDEIERTHTSDSKKANDLIKEVSEKTSCTRIGCLKSKTGDIIMDKHKVLKKWSEYIEGLFYDEKSEKSQIKKNIEGPKIMKTEVKHALNKMKPGKATGPDNIPSEAIESLEDLGIDMATKLLNEIYDTVTIPEDMCKSIFIAIPKKPGATDCTK